MARARLSFVRLCMVWVALPLTACGGELDIPNPATFTARATMTAVRGPANLTTSIAATAPTPTTLTLTLGIPTTGAGGNATRPGGLPAVPSTSIMPTPPGGPPRAATAATGTLSPAISAVLYTDPMNRFTFMRPKNWQETKTTDADVVVVYVSASPDGSFNVIAKQAPAGITLDAYFNGNIATIKKQVPKYQDGPMKAQNVTLGGEAARQFDYYGMPGDTNTYFVQLYCIHKGAAYLLTFATPVDPTSTDMDAFNRAAQIVLSSWKFSS